MKRSRMFGLAAVVTAALWATGAGAADKYFLNADTAWNNTTNWSLTSGGAGGAGVPGAGDNAIFDGSSADCRVDATVNVRGFFILPDYSGTISQGSNNVTVGSSNFVQSAGTFSGSAFTNVLFTANGSFVVTGGTFSAGAQTIKEAGGDWRVDGTHFSADASSVWFNKNGMTNYGSCAFYNLELEVANCGNSINVEDGQTLTVNNILQVGRLTLNQANVPPAGTLVAKGDIVQTSAACNMGGSGLMVIDGTGDQHFTGDPAGHLPPLQIRKSSGTLYLHGTIETKSSWTYVSGTIDPGTSTVYFYHVGSALVITGSHALNNVQFGVLNGGNTFVVADNTTLTVGGTLNIGVNGYVNQTNLPPTGTFDVQGDVVMNNTWNGGGTASLTFSGTNDQTYTDNGGDAGGQVTGTCVINKPAGSVILATDMDGDGAGQDLVVTNGTLDLAGHNLKVADRLDLYGTLKAKGNETVAATTRNFAGASTVAYYDRSVAAVVTNLGATATNFCNLTLGADKTHNFGAGKQYVVTGALAADGTATNRSRLRSTTDGSSWQLNLQGTSLLTNNVSVKDSDASSGPTVNAHGSVNVGHNVNWDFGSSPPGIVNAGYANVAAVTADLMGTLNTNGGSAADVWVFWGTNDASSSFSGWTGSNRMATGVTDTPAGYTNSAAGLIPSTAYCFRYYATNAAGDSWADPTSFTTRPAVVLSNQGGASDVTAGSADVWGSLIYTSKPTHVYLYWGTNDPGPTAAGWSGTPQDLGPDIPTGPLSQGLSGLSPDTQYFYRYYGTNVDGSGWADPAGRFFTWPALSGYGRRMKIAFKGYNPPIAGETLTNFPALVIFDAAHCPGLNYNDFQSAQGYDLRFMNAGLSRRLNHEIERWDPAGSSYVWVQVDALAGSNDFIWAYYGNPAAASEPAVYATNGAAWSDGYLAVWHLNNTNAALKYPDATAHHFDGANAQCTNVSGQIAGAASFGAAAADINVTGIAYGGGATSNYTFEYWLQTTNISADARLTDITSGRLIMGLTADKLRYYDASGAWRPAAGGYGTNVNDMAWHHVAFALNAATGKGIVYEDGVAVTSGAAYTPSPVGGIAHMGGNNTGNGNDYIGLMDEARIATAARSSNWIWACYMTMGSNSVFTDYQIRTAKGGVWLVW